VAKQPSIFIYQVRDQKKSFFVLFFVFVFFVFVL